MEEGRKDITKMVIPVGVVATLLITIVVGSIAYGRVTAQGDRNTNDIANIQNDLKDVPTRNEFNDVKNGINRIEASVNELRTYIIKKQ